MSDDTTEPTTTGRQRTGPAGGEQDEDKGGPQRLARDAEQRSGTGAAPGERRVKKGLVIVNTGHGKGKSTAAFGLMTRAWGRGMRVCALQFIKNENANFGETRAARKMGIEMIAMGDGFTWLSRDIDETAAKAQHGWARAQEKIVSGRYDVVILDEFTYTFKYGWLDVHAVIAWLREHKPPMLHLVITGRDAPPELIDYADLVTEMRLVKHPYHDQGIRAQAGIEY
jgi:cob(I)alamin adenosyltransferase